METDFRLPSLEARYTKSWFARRKKLLWRMPIVAEAINNTWHPATVIDVGCGDGYVVQGLLDCGVDAWGIEGSLECCGLLSAPPDRVLLLDARIPWSHEGPPFDLVCSLEVAEHIDPLYAETFVDNLIGLGRKVLLTAAPPGQKGHHHVNCRPRSYWIDLFWQRGYRPAPQALHTFREQLTPWSHRKELEVYRANGLCFAND